MNVNKHQNKNLDDVTYYCNYLLQKDKYRLLNYIIP